MHRVSVHRDIEVPADVAWSILDDFGGVYRYHPNVESSPIQNGLGSGVGAQRVCHFDDGGAISEEVTAYEAGRKLTVEITDPGKYPLQTAVAVMSVEPRGEDRSRVGIEMSFKPKGGPLGWLMAKAVMESQFRKVLGSVLEGIETHATTGEIVSRKRSRTAA